MSSDSAAVFKIFGDVVKEPLRLEMPIKKMTVIDYKGYRIEVCPVGKGWRAWSASVLDIVLKVQRPEFHYSHGGV